jgi:hypothetical protein
MGGLAIPAMARDERNKEGNAATIQRGITV